MAFCWVVSRRVTRTNCPGHSLRSEFGNVPFSLIVPVVMSTELSMKVSTPVSSSAGLFLEVPRGPRVSARPCTLDVRQLSFGHANVT